MPTHKLIVRESIYGHVLNKWGQRWLKRAAEVADWSKDPSTKVGAIAVDPKDRRSLAEGYNGFPRMMEDRREWLQNRKLKIQRTIHAEVNVICDAVLSGNTLRGAHLYVHGLHVCGGCAPVIAQSGVVRVVQFVRELGPRWIESTRTARQILWDCDVDVVSIISSVEGYDDVRHEDFSWEDRPA